MSNYCACSGGDEEYTIELNQQGPEGPQGEVGPEGFSPSISVKTNTDKSYILTVVNKEGNFDTPNLYGELEKLNADLSNIPNPAYINGISLASIADDISIITMDSSKITTDIDGNLMLSASSENEGGTETFNYEVVVNPKEQRLELHDKEGNVKIVATTDNIPTIGVATTEVAGVVKPDGSTITVSTDGTISAVAPDLSNYVTNDELSVDLQDINSKIVSKLDTATYEADKTTYATKEEVTTLETTLTADIAALDTNKLASSNIIAGANITIDRNGNNLTINSIGGGGGGSSINDSTISTASTWSSSKINSEITTVANTKNDNIFDIGKFTVVGTPTITDDGVASGFTNDDYLSKSITLDSTKTFDIHLKFRTPETITTGQIIGNSGTPYPVINYRINSTKKIMCEFSITSSTRHYANSTFTVTENTDYFSKISYDKTDVKFYISLDNKNWTTLATFSNIADFIGEHTFNEGIGRAIGSTTYAYPFTGSIDLNALKIIVDGKQVFNGLMESTKPIYDKITSTNTALTTLETDTDNNFSAVNSALNEKANLSDLAGYVPYAGNNTFTGTNTFKGTIDFNQNLPSSSASNTIGITSNVSMQIGSPTNVDQQCIYVARNTSSKGATYMKFGPVNSGRAVFSILRSSTINASTASTVDFSYDESGVYYKTASSDEINLIELINTMSSTISSLTDRISALETEINGGNA